MFVTILTIIYSSIALYIIVRFIRENTPKMTIWTNKVLTKYQRMILSGRNWRSSDIDDEQMSGLTEKAKA